MVASIDEGSDVVRPPSGSRILALLPSAFVGVVLLWLFGALALRILPTGGSPSLPTGTWSVFFLSLKTTVCISLWVSTVVTFFALCLSYLLLHSKKSTFYVALIALVSSMWLSIIVRSHSWVLLLGRQGLVEELLSFLGVRTLHHVELLYSPTAVVIGMTHILLPISSLIIFSSLGRRQGRLRDVARLFDAPSGLYVLTVFIPMCKSGILLSWLLVFIISLGFYITPELLGGGKGSTLMVASLIDEQVSMLGNLRAGAALSLALLAAILGPIVSVSMMLRRYRRSDSDA